MKGFLKKYLPESIVVYLARTIDNFKYWKKGFLKRNPIFIAPSLLINSNYRREYRAFLEGAYLYEKSLKESKANIHYLRRNVHRLEKGMLMRPRREEFGMRFILGTTKAFRSLLQEKSMEKNLPSELQWSYDVLNEYFSIVKSSKSEFLKAEKIFGECKDSYGKNENPRTKELPYINKKMSLISYEDLLLLSQHRKSTRWYSDKPVNRTDIEKALGIALSAPSSCNRQPFKYYIATEKNKVKDIAKIPAGTVGWFDNIPAIAVLVGRQRAFYDIANRHSIYVDGTLSVMPFIYALETLGLSSCIINWSDDGKREKEMIKQLNLDKDEKVVLSIAIGYADSEGKVAYSKRKNIEEVIKYL
jgi:nitroreductase